MVVKGLDFENVSLVGILDADGLLSFADFRVNERAFQLMEQVSGRAGRKAEQAWFLSRQQKRITRFYDLCSSMIIRYFMKMKWLCGNNFFIRPSAG